MTNGQLAYEADCTGMPIYHTGEARKPWHELPSWAKHSWEKEPMPRDWTNERWRLFLARKL